MKNQSVGWVTLLLVLALTTIMVSCMDDVNTDPKNLLGRWQMEKVIDKGKTALKPKIPDYYNQVEIEFLKNGELEGTYPMDIFTGNYRTAGEDSISMECWQWSKIGITDWGRYLDRNVRSIKTFSIEDRGLNLKYNELHLR